MRLVRAEQVEVDLVSRSQRDRRPPLPLDRRRVLFDAQGSLPPQVLGVGGPVQQNDPDNRDHDPQGREERDRRGEQRRIVDEILQRDHEAGDQHRPDRRVVCGTARGQLPLFRGELLVPVVEPTPIYRRKGWCRARLLGEVDGLGHVPGKGAP